MRCGVHADKVGQRKVRRESCAGAQKVVDKCVGQRVDDRP
jgi:hypothetical protein